MHDAGTLIAAIHRDRGEAQGNYDEFRFFTGLRPSGLIALFVSDFRSRPWDRQCRQGEIPASIGARRKPGKTGAVSSARALQTPRRQLRLRERLAAAGKIDHDHVFVLGSGEPIRDLQIPAKRWPFNL